MQTMYPGQINSPIVYLTSDIDNVTTTITVDDATKLLSAPNLLTIGTGEIAETIQYTNINVNTLTVVRGFQGTARSWISGTRISRNFTAYDYDSLRNNVSTSLQTSQLGVTGGVAEQDDLIAHINDDAEHGDFYRQTVINGGCQVAQDIAKTLSTTPQYGSVDMFSVKATGTAVSAGTITQVTNSTAGITGYALAVTGVTLTGTGIIYTRYRMEAKDAIKLKNKVVSFSCQVYHDVGLNINYTVYVRKPTAVDNYTGVTDIANSGVISVPSGAATTIKFENISLGDISNGLEIEIQVACGAITTKNFHLTEFQLNKGSVVLVFTPEKYPHQLISCQRTFRVGGYGYVGRFYSATTAQVFGSFPIMRIPPTVTLNKTNPTLTELGVALRVGTNSTIFSIYSANNGFQFDVNGFTDAGVGSLASMLDNCVNFDARL